MEENAVLHRITYSDQQWALLLDHMAKGGFPIVAEFLGEWVTEGQRDDDKVTVVLGGGFLKVINDTLWTIPYKEFYG